MFEPEETGGMVGRDTQTPGPFSCGDAPECHTGDCSCQTSLRPATMGETGDYFAGHRVIEGARETEHGLLVPAERNIVLYDTRYLESDVHDGDHPRDDIRTSVFDADDIEEAAAIIEREGLSFAATGTDWAANPDGSTTVNYATGEMSEVTAHLYGWTENEIRAIIERVG